MTSRGKGSAAVALSVIVAALLGVIIALNGGRSAKHGRAGPDVGGPVLIGANVNRIFDAPGYTPAQQRLLVRALAATGVDTARSDAFWELTEPAPPRHGAHRFDWTFDDRVAGTLAAAGLRWLPIVDYSAGWARTDPTLLHSPPRDPAAYAAFAGALARRYGPGGSFWIEHPGLAPRPVRAYEVWNEPDTPTFWGPVPNPEAYSRLYVAARIAIHNVDPDATVMVGGLQHPAAFLAALLNADPALRSAIDAVAIHPYGDTTNAVLELVRGARVSLRGLGMAGVPLYLTEFGWVTSPPSAHHYVPAPARPSLVRTTIASLAHTDCLVAGIIIYTWVTPESNPADPEDWYGLEPPSGGTSADATALALGTREARAARPVLPVCG